MDAIIAYELTKNYDQIPALRGINLTVPQGSALACVGPLASGKTSLIRLLCGLVKPSAGECSVMGLSPVHEAKRLHGLMGTALTSSRLYNTMSLFDNLRFFAGLYGIERSAAAQRVSFLMRRLGLWEDRDKRPYTLPTGVLRRAGLCRALVHSPRVLLIDEDGDGMDLETAGRVKEMLCYVKEEEGVTLFLCTRDMDYAQQVMESFKEPGLYALLHQGALIARGELESLRLSRGVRLKAALRIKDGDKAPEGFRLEDGLWQREIGGEQEMPGLISKAVESGVGLYEARLIRPSLSRIYQAYLDVGQTIMQKEAPADGQHPEEAKQ